MLPATVKLFGRLGLLLGERTVSLQLEPGARLADLLQALTERFGEQFSEAIFREPGVLQTYMRIFVNDERVDDLMMELPQGAGGASGSATEVGLILLAAVEGG